MTRLPSCCLWFVVLHLFTAAARALSLPSAEDTSTSTTGHLTRNAGVVGTLSIAADRPAFARFDVAAYAESVKAEDVIRARLTFYIARVHKAGALGVHTVNADWAEQVDTKVAPPAFTEEALATVPQELVRAKQYVTIDVTEQVKSWLLAPESDFGFAIRSVGGTSVVVASKEGPGLGGAPVLEIDTTVVKTIGDAQLGFGIDVTKFADGSVTNAEFQRLSGTIAPVQTQLNTLTTTASNLALSLESTNSQLNSTAAELTLGLATKVNKAGDTLTGALHLPEDGLTVGVNTLAFASGRVGLGTTTPQADAKLEVRGNIRLSPTGNLFAPGSGENLRIVRGTVRYQGGVLAITAGQGFSVGAIGGNSYPITFTQPFSGPPTILLTLEAGGSVTIVATTNVSATGATISGGMVADGTSMHILAIGPR